MILGLHFGKSMLQLGIACLQNNDPALGIAHRISSPIITENFNIYKTSHLKDIIIIMVDFNPSEEVIKVTRWTYFATVCFIFFFGSWNVI